MKSLCLVKSVPKDVDCWVLQHLVYSPVNVLLFYSRDCHFLIKNKDFNNENGKLFSLQATNIEHDTRHENNWMKN